MDSVGAIYSVDDTIVAIASAAGGAARGLLRLSGPEAASVAASLLDLRAAADDRRDSAAKAPNACALAATPSANNSSHADLPAACLSAGNVSRAHLSAAGLVGAGPRVWPVTLQLPEFYSPLPANWYYWPPGRSYTGQEVVELHTIGSPPLLDALIGALCSAGARLAQPGEFTLRAFLSGRIDLTQAEAVLGVIDAVNRRQWEAAVRQLAGGLSRPLARLRADLLDLLADIEAGLDFADEDIRFIARDEIDRRLSAARSAAETVAGQLESRRLAGDRPRAVLVGPPNAGKSSLFNALVRRSAALVADSAGTTRDYLSAPLDCGGMVWELIDTPGVAPLGPGGDRAAKVAEPVAARPRAAEPSSPAGECPILTPDFPPANTAGLHELVTATARHCMEQADLLLICLPMDGSANAGIAARWTARARELAAASSLPDGARRPRQWRVVYTKSDLCDEPAVPASSDVAGGPLGQSSGGGPPVRIVELSGGPPLPVSSRTGRGLDELCEWLHRVGGEVQSGNGDAVVSTALRCADSIDHARTGLAAAQAACCAGEGDELLAEHLRGVIDALGQIVGAVYTEELLGNIFSRFCVGK